MTHGTAHAATALIRRLAWLVHHGAPFNQVVDCAQKLAAITEDVPVDGAEARKFWVRVPKDAPSLDAFCDSYGSAPMKPNIETEALAAFKDLW